MQSYRLGVHLWHLQRVEEAIKMLGSSLKLLEITHGQNHGMYKDGLEMINICLQGMFYMESLGVKSGWVEFIIRPICPSFFRLNV